MMKKGIALVLALALLTGLAPAGAAGTETGKVTPKVDAGSYFNVALDENGTVWTWGQNDRGQLGDGSTTDRYYAAPVLEDVVDIDAGGDSVMALKADGTLWAWGNNNQGELGVGYGITDVFSPEEVILPNDSGVKDFATGHQYSVVIMNDGTVWAWGYIRYYTTSAGIKGCHVENLDGTGVHTIAASDERSFCLFLAGSGTEEDPGTVYGWGDDVYGWYLTDEKFDSRLPNEITFPESGYTTDIRVGEGTIFAVTNGAEPGIYAWGRNEYGQVGTGSKSEPGEPVTTPNKLTGYANSATRYVAPGWGTSPAALQEDGTVWTWGHDDLLVPPTPAGSTDYGFLKEPVQIPSINHVAELSQGTSHLVALRKDGLVYVRGDNRYGQRGVPDNLGVFDSVEFDLGKPVQTEDGAPLRLRTYPGPVRFLTVGADPRQGTVSGSLSDAYQAGDVITLTARAKQGYLFAGWTAEGIVLEDPSSPALSFSMPAGDVTVTALFERDLPGMAGGGLFFEEAGTADPLAVPISTVEQLAAIGTDPGYPLDGSYVLTADLDLSEWGNWSPIGGEGGCFTGAFDGGGHVISGLTYTGSGPYVGLFGLVNETGVIKNLGLENVSITVYDSSEDCYVGGIVGCFENQYKVSSRAELRNCYVTGEIAADSSGTLYLGGLAGWLAADTTGCFNLAALTGEAGSSTLRADTLYMGGVAGWIDTYLTDPYVVERCFNEGELSPSCVQDSAFVGGVAGYLRGYVEFSQCYNTADVWMSPRSWCGDAAYLGGIAGFSDSSISDCYNLGDVGTGSANSGPYRSMVCGGIVGQYALGSSGETYMISNCYSAGSVIARAWSTGYAGGIVGHVVENSANLYLDGCVALCPQVGVYYDFMMGSTGGSGPFESNVLGNDISVSSDYRNYYWEDLQSVGYDVPAGKPSYSSEVRTRYITDGSWYGDRGWDMGGIWTIDETQNDGLPYFAWVTDGFQLLDYKDGEVELYSRLRAEQLTLCAASYDDDGRLLDTALTTVAPEGGISRIPLPLEEGAQVRVFLWRTMNLKPAAAALRR